MNLIDSIVQRTPTAIVKPKKILSGVPPIRKTGFVMSA